MYEVRREEQDPSQNAVWDLDSLYQAVISEVIYYNHTAHREEHHDFKASKLHIGFSPQAIFDYFLEQEMAGGRPTTAEDEGRIRLACLPEAEASVTDQGIKFQGVYYTSPYAKKQKWYFKAKQFGVFNITVKWSRTSGDTIWFQSPENKVIAFKIKPDKSRRYQRQAWEAIAIRQTEYARERHDAKRKKAQSELEKDHKQRQLLQGNQDEIKGLPVNTVKSRQSGIQERKDEQSIIDKSNIDKRNKAAISKIVTKHPDEGDSTDEPISKPSNKNAKKRKRKSLNSRLQNSKNQKKGS